MTTVTQVEQARLTAAPGASGSDIPGVELGMLSAVLPRSSEQALLLGGENGMSDEKVSPGPRGLIGSSWGQPEDRLVCGVGVSGRDGGRRDGAHSADVR